MERPLRPAFFVGVASSHLRKTIYTAIAVPDKVYPMDLYNALLRTNLEVDVNYGWITSKGRYVSSEKAAELALETNLLDKVVKYLITEDYQGFWRTP